MAVPRTLYVWLALLLLFSVLGGERAGRRKAAVEGSPLSSRSFERYVTAETSAREAFGTSSLLSEKTRKNSLSKAVADYRFLSAATPSPNMPRRVVILEHAQSKPFDETFLRRELTPDLRKSKVAQTEIDREIALWRSVYGSGAATRKRADASRLTEAENQFRAMRLGFLEHAVLRDLYAGAGQKQRAQTFQGALDRAAAQHTTRQLTVALPIFLLLLVGIPLLLFFVISAARGRWQNVGRVATQTQRLGWGDLLDGFVFYLALVRGTGFIVGMALGRVLENPGVRQTVALQAIIYAGTGLGAVAYLAAKARRRGVTLADIGLRSVGGRGAADIGYGILGYCATLPLTLGLGLLARLIFRHNPNTSPNPVLPLITAERDWQWRLVIFLLVAVGAPLFEELFFRGALLSGLRTRFGWVVSAAISAFAFAVVHPVQDWLPIFGLGIAFGTMREMRQSLIPGMVAHCLQNSFAFFALSTLFRN